MMAVDLLIFVRFFLKIVAVDGSASYADEMRRWYVLWLCLNTVCYDCPVVNLAVFLLFIFTFKTAVVFFLLFALSSMKKFDIVSNAMCNDYTIWMKSNS